MTAAPLGELKPLMQEGWNNFLLCMWQVGKVVVLDGNQGTTHYIVLLKHIT